MEVTTKTMLSNLYGLMMEINFHRASEDVLADLETAPNARVNKHLAKIKLLSSKLKAESNKQFFQKAYDLISELRSRGMEELKKLISPAEQETLIPLFRKFEEITDKDKVSILEDQELLHLIELLKGRIDDATT